MQPTVLLIEDDENDILLLQRVFRRMEAHPRIEVVRNGTEAISYLERNNGHSVLPCLILLDWKMPQMDGLEFLQWLNQQTAIRHVPVLILASWTHPDQERRATELGARGFLQKPLSANTVRQLRAALETYCRP